MSLLDILSVTLNVSRHLLVCVCLRCEQASASQMKFFKERQNGPNSLSHPAFSKSTSRCCFGQIKCLWLFLSNQTKEDETLHVCTFVTYILVYIVV